MKLVYFFGTFFFSSLGLADANFHCHSLPGMAVQTFEYGSSNCGEFDSKSNSLKITSEGERDVLCMYQAACKAVTRKASAQEPDKLPADQIVQQLQQGRMKLSVLLCKGKGQSQAGVIYQANCPAPTECQKDIFYNVSTVSVAPPLPSTIRVLPKTPNESSGANQ
ncbi:MAG: hypothetical protein EOP05_14545 [Proteobacteria bacterium]|nr:MAG: hypothetical protein EOP05_14545 [Pseudomonadota bacterium]